MGTSGLVPIGNQSSIQIDGKKAFRLLTGNAGETVPKAIGYVSKVNDYVFMVVIVSQNATLYPLQSAIEAMSLGSTIETNTAAP